MIPSVPTPSPLSPSFESRHDDSQVDPSPSSPIFSPSSSTSHGESLKSSNQEAKKKKKKKKKKMSDKREANHAIIAPNALPAEKPSDPLQKVKFPYKLCKGDHLF